MNNKKIAVIGAGPMGLAVAYELIKQGYRPEVFEADDRVGGMTATFDFDGVDIERYYHFHCTSDDDFFQMLEELNLKHHLRWVKTKMGYWYQDQLQDWGNPLALLKFKGLGIIDKFRYGLHAFFATKRNNWQALEKYDAKTWVRKWVGAKAYRVLWKKLFELKFYHHTDNLSAPWIWSRIRRVGRSRYDLFNEQLGYLSGGSKTLLSAMQQFIEQNGGRIHLNANIEKVNLEQQTVTGVTVNQKTLSFSQVISTIPLPIFAKIAPDLPPETLNQYQNKPSIGVVCLIAKLKRPLTDKFWLNVNDEQMDIPGIIEYSNLNPEVGHIVYVPYYLPREHQKFSDSDDTYRQKATAFFQVINPELTEQDIIDIRVHRYAFAQPICPPNFQQTLPKEKTPIKGLRAADTSFYYPEDRGISESIGYGRAMAKRAIND